MNRDTKVKYDAEYVASRYGTYTTGDALSEIRINHLNEILYKATGIPDRPRRLLDVGYGDGAFIRMAKRYAYDAKGYDINPTVYPGVRRVDLPSDDNPVRYDVITFFDSLEHFEDLRDISQVSRYADWIVVSHPRLPQDISDLRTWKHYRPGEHHYHFSTLGLEDLFSHGNECLARCVDYSCPEDEIRGKLSDGHSNISTVILRIT
jgi:hypothetical protein